jgi:tubulin polyglutamylase TTLL6/13
MGLDIMIDEKLKPWLIEVNHLSSFGTDSPLDKKIKFDLIWDTFNLLNLSVKRKRKTKQEVSDRFAKRMVRDGTLTKA